MLGTQGPMIPRALHSTHSGVVCVLYWCMCVGLSAVCSPKPRVHAGAQRPCPGAAEA